jgi:hypothetical protein
MFAGVDVVDAVLIGSGLSFLLLAIAERRQF